MTVLAIVLRLANIILMLGVPVALALGIYRRGKSGFRPIWIGAAGFILSQVGHIPFNQFLLLPALGIRADSFATEGGFRLLVIGVAVGLSAGVFEEATRYLILKFWLKGDHQELLPLKYGVGHGGIEAVLTGLLALTAFVQVLALSGEGLAGFEPEQAALIKSQVDAYWAVPWQQSLLGAWERVSALAFHLGASILVYKSIRERNLLWLLAAILGHTALNAFAVSAVSRIDLVLLEGILFLFGGGWLAWAWTLRPRDPDQLDGGLEKPSEVPLPDPRITPGQIEESRYDD